MQTTTRADAARAALDTHRNMDIARRHGLTLVLAGDGTPAALEAWAEWWGTEWSDAVGAWHRAMADLSDALGEEFPGHVPEVFQPVCERILAEGAGR